MCQYQRETYVETCPIVVSTAASSLLTLNRLLIELRITRKDPGIAAVFRRRLLANNSEDHFSPTSVFLMQRTPDRLVIDGDDVR